jgi:hypothetical protein|tara:strand:- start:610 stop:1434 length:825 start_codon:yes stop_codon:yes gene_type:complete
MDCCKHKKSAKKCMRKSDKKIFSLPRRFTRKRCKKGAKGFTMKASCAPYKGCKKGGSKKNKTKKGQRGAGAKQSTGRMITEAEKYPVSIIDDFIIEDKKRKTVIRDNNMTPIEILQWMVVEYEWSARDYNKLAHEQFNMGQEEESQESRNTAMDYKEKVLFGRRLLYDMGVLPKMNSIIYHPLMDTEQLEQELMGEEEKRGFKTPINPIEIQIQQQEYKQTPPRPPQNTNNPPPKVSYTPTASNLEEGRSNEKGSRTRSGPLPHPLNVDNIEKV